MTQITLETIYTELTSLRSELTSFRSEVDARLNTIEVRVIGLPIIGESISVLQRNLRMVTSAINDMARVNITAGEVEALHNELEHIIARQGELETRILALEQQAK